MSKGTRWMGAALTTLFACGLATEAGGQQPQYNFGPCPQTSVILGSEGPDTITGTPNADTILSFGANDIVLKHLIDAMAEMYPAIPICMPVPPR